MFKNVDTLGTQYGLPGVPQGGEGSHPFPLIAISYEFPVHCHGRGRGFEPRRPRHISKGLMGCMAVETETPKRHSMKIEFS
jgi:hypothetical protein